MADTVGRSKAVCRRQRQNPQNFRRACTDEVQKPASEICNLVLDNVDSVFKMVTKSRLRLALAAEKGVDFKKLKEKRKRKENAKQKTVEQGQQAEVDNGVDHDEEVSEDDEEETDGEEDTVSKRDKPYNPPKMLTPAQMNAITVDESDSSDSSIEFDERITTARSNGKVDSRVKKTQIQAKPAKHEREPEEEEADDDEEEIPVSDLEDLDDEDREDLISHTRLTINNTSALLTALKRISMPTDSSVSFATHQSIVSSTDTSASIPDVSDDLQRELAFYSQSLDAVREGRARLRAEGVHFSRPKDYFAEMVKEDAHMEKVKAKLVEEAASKKAATEARKLRDLKKFGKQVQVAKLQERQKAKRETLDKIKTLKRSEFYRPAVASTIANHPTHQTQNVKNPVPMWEPRRQIFSTLALKTSSPRDLTAQVRVGDKWGPESPIRSAKKRMTSTGSEAKSVIQSPVMP